MARAPHTCALCWFGCSRMREPRRCGGCLRGFIETLLHAQQRRFRQCIRAGLRRCVIHARSAQCPRLCLCWLGSSLLMTFKSFSCVRRVQFEGLTHTHTHARTRTHTRCGNDEHSASITSPHLYCPLNAENFHDNFVLSL